MAVRLAQHPDAETPVVEIAQFTEQPKASVDQTTIAIPVSAARHLIRAVAHVMWTAQGVVQ